MNMKTLHLLIFLFCVALTHVNAALQLSLTPSVQSSAKGAEIVFTGALTNTSATDRLFINDISFALSGASATNLTPATNAFFTNVPGILLPNESYAVGEVFRIVLSAGAPFGEYGGTVSILGGTSITATTSLANTAFTIRVPNPTDDNADTDHDGVLNLLEYALNLDSQVADASALPSATTSGSYLTFTYTPNAAATDVTCVVEASTDLINWNTSDVEEVTPLSALPSGTRTYRYKSATNAAARGFLRLRVVR
jgi:hypothetical protein